MNRTKSLRQLFVSATSFMLVALAACGGEEDAAAPLAETAAETPEAPTPEPVAEPEEAEPQAEPEAEVAEAEVEPVEADLPATNAPAYAAAPTACEPNPDSAPATPIRLRDLTRGEPDFPTAAALSATCEHDPAELAEAFNQGGLRRHRQRDYVQSQHYFTQAVLVDPSQLSPRFNLACALARLSALDEAIHQLRELEKAGPEGVEYAGRAQRDRDFGEFHGTPALMALVHGLPASVEAITSGEDEQVYADEDSTSDGDTLFVVLGEKVWEHGVLSADEFPAFVLAMEPDRRRFRFFNERPTDEVRAALEAMGLAPMLRHVGWTPEAGRSFLVSVVSSRDEDRSTIYLASVTDEGTLQPVDSRDLPAVNCDEGDQVVRTFVEAEDKRAFGYITGCLSAAPATFERCLYHFDAERGVLRRCGHGETAAVTPEP